MENELPDFFAYFLVNEVGAEAVTAKAVRGCYEACDMAAPSWLASHFSNGLKKPRRYIKTSGGYRLENKRREEIAAALGSSKSAVQPTPALDRLELFIPAGPKRDFLHETIVCLGAGANRAAVVMSWNLALHHLQDHVLADAVRLAAFNTALGANTDKRVKVKSVAKQDDFTEMPESLFLLFCRQSKLVTSSVFNKLETRLDERNAAAHPSGVKVGPSVAHAYIEDLVDNVLLKYAA
jgi:hypothetical protein